ncbi:MAG: cyclic lactone autoinducer peptide [Clostridium sp.]|nr:cyclic lactone autoinducer peptide [Clostridium sp.]MCM1425630.1 cyclic lactone autoinducer peptide [Eubacterium sp.]
MNNNTSHAPQTKGGLMKLMNTCAFALMVGSVNSACAWIHHQPVVPEDAKKFRKF